MKEIGGYFEIELSQKRGYHSGAIKLNSGRNAFKYILRSQGIHKVYIPAYICNSIIEPLQELDVSYEFYNVDEKFEIVQELVLKDNERILYVNYYSLKSIYIENLASIYGDKLIVDNTQAFYVMPIEYIDTLYSPRKYFGVCDGGYLYTQKQLDEILERDISYNNTLQLLGRADVSASAYYESYKESEASLSKKPIKKMSKLTSRILSSIDYIGASIVRERNYYYLHSELNKHNLINIDISISAPFVYPLKVDDEKLRAKLISNQVYVAKYWSEVLEREQTTSIEKEMVENIVPLPIDQRYGMDEMKRIVDIIKDELE